MRSSFSGFSPWPGSRRSLAARGQFLTTFAGLGFAVALSLLALGSYLIEEQFRDPVGAGAAGLLSASLLIATAFTLLYCLLRPSRKMRRRGVVRPVPVPGEPGTIVIAENDPVVARGNKGQRIENGNRALMLGRYVDRTRVRIRR